MIMKIITTCFLILCVCPLWISYSSLHKESEYSNSNPSLLFPTNYIKLDPSKEIKLNLTNYVEVKSTEIPLDPLESLSVERILEKANVEQKLINCSYKTRIEKLRKELSSSVSYVTCMDFIKGKDRTDCYKNIMRHNEQGTIVIDSVCTHQ